MSKLWPFLGVECVVCPWHNIPISLADGTKMSKPVTFDPVSRKPIPSPCYIKSRDQFQRVHPAVIKEDKVYVNVVGPFAKTLESDRYAFRKI